MITKTYQALHYQSYEMYVMFQGKRTLISFRGGSLRPPINGKFQTTDPVLQDILAKDSSNGISFKEISSFDDEAEPVIEKSDIKKAEGINTVQGARDYLLAKIDGLTQGSLPNKTAVMAIAEKYKIAFPDLK